LQWLTALEFEVGFPNSELRTTALSEPQLEAPYKPIFISCYFRRP